MSLEVYDLNNPTTRYEISHAISVLLSVYYNDIGKMTVVMPINDYNVAVLKQDHVVYDTERSAVYIIQNVKVDTKLNRITANGFTADWLLNQRVIAEKVKINNVERDSYSTITANLRGLSRVSLAPVQGLEGNVDDAELMGGQLLDSLADVWEEVELGRRMLWDDATRGYTFQLYKGVDRTQGIHAVVFSEEQGTAQQLVINDDASGYKNMSYIVAEFSDDTTELLSVGTATGDDRREAWTKTTIRQTSEETKEETRKRAKAEAALTLARSLQRKNFSVVVDPAELGRAYNLGDVVACVSVRFGVQFTARVTGIKYTMDIQGEKTEVILGTPNITAIGGLELGRN